MYTNRTFYIKEETAKKLKVLMGRYAKSASKIVDELICHRFNAINKPKVDSVESKENEIG